MISIPDDVQDVPWHILVPTFVDHLKLKRSEKQEGKAGHKNQNCLLKTDCEVWIVSVPRQVGVPQRVRAKRFVTHFYTPYEIL